MRTCYKDGGQSCVSIIGWMDVENGDKDYRPYSTLRRSRRYAEQSASFCNYIHT